MKGKKLGKKLLALALCATSAVSLFACGGGSGGNGGGNKIDGDLDLQGGTADNSASTIEVNIYNAGYGVEWFNACAKAFMAKNPQYAIKAQSLSDSTSPSNMIKSGPKNCTVDLFILGGTLNGLVSAGSKALAGYDVALESLDDVYNATVPGENRTVLDKMYDFSSKMYLVDVEIGGKAEQHYYGMPWGYGFSGLMYNVALFAEAGLTHEPRTTDELLRYCVALKEKGITPFIYSAADDYFEYCADVWWAQYEGQKGLDNFYNGKINDNADPDENTSIEIFRQEGLYEMFKVFEDMLHPDKDYVYEFVESLSYTEAQAYFLSGDKQYGAMQPNGVWLENEMQNSSASGAISVKDIRPMKTPVLSALSDKMSYWDKSVNFTEASKTMTAEERKVYDDKLCALIDYVDGVAEKPDWATEADVKQMQESRAYQASGVGSTMSIPVYATAKEGAKEFLKFMATDEAQELFLANTAGNSLPYDYDITKWSGYANMSEFAKRKFEILETSVGVIGEDYYPTYYIGGMRYDQGLKNYNFCITFGARNAGLKTAQEVVDSAYNYYKSFMKKLLQDSGLL
ncbi:MAG: extracellular solute-binding protein [Clostridia bacterium]|nr:extracellular solute-binding protein [Clostridia bacterium]